MYVTVIRLDRTRPWQGRRETPTSSMLRTLHFVASLAFFNLIDAEEFLRSNNFYLS